MDTRFSIVNAHFIVAATAIAGTLLRSKRL